MNLVLIFVFFVVKNILPQSAQRKTQRTQK